MELISLMWKCFAAYPDIWKKTESWSAETYNPDKDNRRWSESCLQHRSVPAVLFLKRFLPLSYPDYKFPLTIYSDKRLPKKGELKDNFCNFDRPRIQLFNEERVYDSLVDAGLFPDKDNRRWSESCLQHRSVPAVLFLKRFLPLSYPDNFQCLQKKGELKDNFCNFDRPRIQLFNEERVYDSLVDAGLFPEFSNSFLVIAKREEE